MRVVTTDWDAFVADELASRSGAGLLRSLRPLERDGGWVVTEDGRRLLDLSSNDYLGLASHPAVAEAAARAARRGSGATASRLIVGTDSQYSAFEEKLADFQGTEAALVFGSGYLANVGTIGCLVGPGDAVFSDELNHASIIDGCRLSRATIHRYGTALFVDEAHAVGVLGPHGEGYAHEVGVADRVDLHMGTFGKAFGAYGAYVAGQSPWIDYLVNAGRTFVFTTALPPAVIAAADAALDLVRDGDDLRADLQAKAGRFRRRLDRVGLDTRGSSTQIVPAVVGDSERAVELSQQLEERGVLGVAIRPPTVPHGTARVRFSLSVLNEDADLERALDAIELTAGNTTAP